MQADCQLLGQTEREAEITAPVVQKSREGGQGEVGNLFSFLVSWEMVVTFLFAVWIFFCFHPTGSEM